MIDDETRKLELYRVTENGKVIADVVAASYEEAIQKAIELWAPKAILEPKVLLAEIVDIGRIYEAGN